MSASGYVSHDIMRHPVGNFRPRAYRWQFPGTSSVKAVLDLKLCAGLFSFRISESISGVSVTRLVGVSY